MLIRLFSVFFVVFFTLTSSPVFANNTHKNKLMIAEENNASKESAVLSTLSVLNENEIAAAKEALKKSSNANVKDFAELMIKDHTQNLDDTQSLMDKLNLKASEPAPVVELKKKGKKTLESLSSLEGKKFDDVYISDMVKGHAAALKLVQHLIKTTQNSEIKNHLEKTEQTIEHHLEKAKEVQKELKA